MNHSEVSSQQTQAAPPAPRESRGSIGAMLDAAGATKLTGNTDTMAAVIMGDQLECQPFEHYDYIMLMFRNEQDFQQACERLGIKKVEIAYPGGKPKIGLGRVIDGAKAIRILTEGK